MPIYEYACKNCNHTLDALQKMSDEPLVDCPKCGKPQLKRLISAPRFRLKGQGWYETDFKKDNQRNLVSGDAEPVKSDTAKADAAKPDAATADTSKSESAKSTTETTKSPDKAAPGSAKKADSSDSA